MESGNTCIDCHKGIAHKSVRSLLDDKELEELEKPLAAYVRKIPQSYIDGLKRGEQRDADAEAKRTSEIAAAAEAIAADRMKAAARGSAQGGASSTAAADMVAVGKIDWSMVEAKTVSVFYPGQASFEWIQDARQHGGSRAFLRSGDRCSECHANEVRDMGEKIVKGGKVEPTPIPGKRGSVDLKVQAAHDGEKVYFRFQWPNAVHTPAPFADGGKMDPANQVKLAIMVAGLGIERVEQGGCWVTCHNDARSMPDAPKPEALSSFPGTNLIDLKDGVTKYLGESRTEIEIKGTDGKPRGGWDKLKSQDELAALLKSGSAMDLIRFRSGAAPEHGHVLAERVMQGGVPIEAAGALDGDTWTVVMARPLKSDRPGDVTFEPGKLYTIGFALHDDYAARFHHVSLEFRFGLDMPDAEINARKQ
jgi:cytochrome c-type protein NapC